MIIKGLSLSLRSSSKDRRSGTVKLKSNMKFGRYRTNVTGHRSQVQVIALLINNWDKQFSLKLKLYFGFWFLMERVYNVSYRMCIECAWCLLLNVWDRVHPTGGGVFIAASSDLISCRESTVEIDCEILWVKINIVGWRPCMLVPFITEMKETP